MLGVGSSRSGVASWGLVVGVGLVGLVVSSTGCRHERREEARKEERQDRREDVKDSRAGWEKLGERTVHGKADHDTIAVGGREGRFTRIMLVCERSALEVFDVEVTFGDGEKFEPRTRLVFAEGSRSRTIDLPGGERVIKKVEFRYGNLPGGGRAELELWAK